MRGKNEKQDGPNPGGRQAALTGLTGGHRNPGQRAQNRFTETAVLGDVALCQSAKSALFQTRTGLAKPVPVLTNLHRSVW